jgi:hypothetical protein
MTVKELKDKLKNIDDDFNIEVIAKSNSETEYKLVKLKITDIADIGYSSKLVILDGDFIF